jgi:hypothetical protein
MVVVKINT